MNGKHYIGEKALSLTEYEKNPGITGVILWVDDNNCYQSGNDTGTVIEQDCPYASQQMADNLLSALRGYQYQPLDANGAKLTPIAELGDGITVNGLYTQLAYQNIRFSSGEVVDVSAPGSNETLHEYKTEGETTKWFSHQIAETRSEIIKTSEEITLLIDNEIQGLSSQFTVQLGQIRAELTDEINGLSASVDLKFDGLEASFEDEINGLSADFDVKLNGLQANFEDEINGLSSTLNVKIDGIEASLEDEINGLSSSINLQIDSITSTVQGQGGQISQIQQTVTGISSQVSGLDGRVTLVEQTADGLQTQINGVNGEVTTISATIDGLTVTDSSGQTVINGSMIRTDNLYVNAANITGSLVIGQLPDNVATTGDIPDRVSELENDEGYQTERGVVTIIDGTVTADYVEALGVRARYLQGETVQLLSSSGSLVGTMDIVNTNTGDGLTIGTNRGGIRIETGQSGNIYISSGYGPFLMLGYGDTGSTAMCQLGGGPLVIPGASYGSRAPSGSGEYGEVYFQLE